MLRGSQFGLVSSRTRRRPSRRRLRSSSRGSTGYSGSSAGAFMARARSRWSALASSVLSLTMVITMGLISPLGACVWADRRRGAGLISGSPQPPQRTKCRYTGHIGGCAGISRPVARASHCAAQIDQGRLPARRRLPLLLLRPGAQARHPPLGRRARAAGAGPGDDQRRRCSARPTSRSGPPVGGLPAELAAVVARLRIRPAEARMLSAIRWEGRAPSTEDDWLFLAEAVRRACPE